MKLKTEIIIIGSFLALILLLCYFGYSNYQNKQLLKASESISKQIINEVNNRALNQKKTDSINIIRLHKNIDSISYEIDKKQSQINRLTKLQQNEINKILFITDFQRKHIVDSLTNYINRK